MIEDAAGAPHLKPSNEANGGRKPNAGAITGFTMALTDWKVWYLTIMAYLMVITTSFYMYFPTLAFTMGYNPTITLLLCAPPWLVGAAWALWLSRHSDKTGERCMHTIVSLAIGIAGFLLAMSTMNTAVRYISLFLMTQSSAGFICFLAWASSTISSPPAKRAVALAFINAFSQSGNIVASYVWPKSWGPTYNKSYATCMVTALLGIMMCLWLRRILERLNRDMDLADERGHEGIASDGKGWRYHV